MESKEPVTCDRCKYAMPVNIKNNNYYCVPPCGSCGIVKGTHTCQKGVQKNVPIRKTERGWNDSYAHLG